MRLGNYIDVGVALQINEVDGICWDPWLLFIDYDCCLLTSVVVTCCYVIILVVT